MGAEVLNGSVEAGDRVAIGVRDGNSGGIRAGEILEVIRHDKDRWDWKTQTRVPAYSLRVRVEYSSDTLPQRPQVYGTDNAVKLS